MMPTTVRTISAVTMFLFQAEEVILNTNNMILVANGMNELT